MLRAALQNCSFLDLCTASYVNMYIVGNRNCAR